METGWWPIGGCGVGLSRCGEGEIFDSMPSPGAGEAMGIEGNGDVALTGGPYAAVRRGWEECAADTWPDRAWVAVMGWRVGCRGSVPLRNKKLFLDYD
jgi:hypothetical protein